MSKQTKSPPVEPAKNADTAAEIDALAAIINALAPLTGAQRSRVLRYVAETLAIYIGDQP